MGFLFLKHPPPPREVLLVYQYIIHPKWCLLLLGSTDEQLSGTTSRLAGCPFVVRCLAAATAIVFIAAVGKCGQQSWSRRGPELSSWSHMYLQWNKKQGLPTNLGNLKRDHQLVSSFLKKYLHGVDGRCDSTLYLSYFFINIYIYIYMYLIFKWIYIYYIYMYICCNYTTHLVHGGMTPKRRKTNA